MNKNTISEADIIYLVVCSGIAFMVLVCLLILFFYFSLKKINKMEIKQKNQEIQHQKELVNSILKTQEAERTRIAQDLHDDISSKLNVISLNTHLLQTKNLTQAETINITNTILNYTKLVIEDSRLIAHDLLPPVLQNFGLHEGITELCEDISNHKFVKISYSNQVIFDEIEKDKQLHIFRIVQELINNSIMHGKATQINLIFTQKEEVITLNFSDNGKGFTADDKRISKGMGTKNIESRVNFLQGSVAVTSEINQGVTYTINLKL